MTDTKRRVAEVHPPLLGARLVRSLRGFDGIRGWRRIAEFLAPSQIAGSFQVQNESGIFAGDLSSYIDRQIYLYGDYEASYIRQLLPFLPANRRRCILDIGANIGTHSAAFARHFANVHAFEPNPQLWPQFERHVALNNFTNVELHKVGLSDAESTIPFYLTEHDNLGLGTAAPDQAYDVPLKPAGTIHVVPGDAYLQSRNITNIDFVKIDVQGLELKVLSGLKETLRTHRPYLWLEVNEPTLKIAGSIDGLRRLMPFECDLYRFHQRRGLRNTWQLQAVTENPVPSGDYIFAPAGST